MPSVQQSLLVLKEYEETFRPTLLYSVQLYTGQTVYFTSAADSSGTGLTWQGNTYQNRITGQRISGLGSQSSIGIDVFGQVGLDLADADGEMWYYEQAYGFQGATLTATLVMFDPASGQFSTDSQVIFTGTCDPAVHSNLVTSISALTKNALTKQSLPNRPIQRTCPHWFPPDAASRVQAAGNPLSKYYLCGYSPDQAGGLGNYGPGGVPYTSCTYEPAGCKARGMFSTDSSSRYTSTFGGVQWEPPATFKGKSFTQGKTIQGVNNANPAKWTQQVPMHWGTAWVPGVWANVVGDPNSTRGELMLSAFSLQSAANDITTVGIQAVVINGLLVPRNDQTSDLLFRWYLVSTGKRNGAVNQTQIYNGTGDPYGSIAVIMPIVYPDVASSNSTPNAIALLGNREIPVYTSTTQYILQRTNNMAWCVLDVIRTLRPDLFAQLSLGTFIDYATFCGQSVSYTNLYGATATHQRFTCSLVLTQKQSGQSIIDGLKIAGRFLLRPSAGGTGIDLLCKRTLYGQQGSAVSGSNYNSPIASFKDTDSPTGSPTGVGYAAYDFNESTYLQGSVKILQDPISNTPVIIQASINDEDNDYITDTVTIADPLAFQRAQQEIQTVLPVLGFPNYDQAYRNIQCYMAERFRGNPRDDSGGTIRVQLESTSRVAHLRMGDIVRFKNDRLGISPQLFRVESIAITADYKRSQLVLRWHEDAWYTDGYGQLPSPYVANYLGSALSKTPYPWQPNYAPSRAYDVIHDTFGHASTYNTFGLTAGYEELPDQSIAPEVIITGNQTVNKTNNSALAPRIARQGTWQGNSSGDFPDGKTWYCYVTSVDASGNESRIQGLPCVTDVPGAGNANTITIPVYQWPAGATGYRVYAGSSPGLVVQVGAGTGTPSSVAAANYIEAGQGPVDTNFDHYVVRAKKVSAASYYLLLGPGITAYGAQLNTMAAQYIVFGYAYNPITKQIYTPADNELQNYVLIPVFQTGGGVIPYENLEIESNFGLQCYIKWTTLSSLYPGPNDLTQLNLSQMWFIAVRKISSAGGTAIQFADNSDLTSYGGYTHQVRVIGGTGKDQNPRSIVAGNTTGGIAIDSAFDVPLDSTSIVLIEETGWSIEDKHSQMVNYTTAQMQLRLKFPNVGSQLWLVQVATVSKDGLESSANLHPYRLFFWQGLPQGMALFQGTNILPNSALVESGNAGEIAAGWVVRSGPNSVTCDLSAEQVYSGKNAFRFHGGEQDIPANGTTQATLVGLAYSAPLPVPGPGESYFIRCAGRCTPSVPVPAGVQFVFGFRVTVWYTDGTLDTATAGGPIINWSEWELTSGTMAVNASKLPAAMGVDIEVYWINNNGTPQNILTGGNSFYGYVSGLRMVRVIDVGTEATAVSSSWLNGQGAIVPAQVVPISVSQNTNDGSGNCTISITWPSSPMLRADGSTVTVAAGTFTWTGLSVGEYYIYPRVAATAGTSTTMHITSGDPPTSPPMSPSAALAMQSTSDGWYPQPMITVTTPSNGGTGGGSGGGGASCPEAHELVYVDGKGVIAVGEVKAGDLIRGKDWKTGLTVFRRVDSVELVASSTWRVVKGHRVSPMHPVSMPEKLKWEYPDRIGTVNTEMGVRVRIKLQVPHNSYDAQNFALVTPKGEESLIVHNYYVAPC